MEKSLFISVNDVVKFTPVGGNVDPDKVRPYIDLMQEIEVKSKLGSKLYEKIISDWEANTITAEYKFLITEFLAPMLRHYTAAAVIEGLSYNVTDGGVFKHQSENSEIPSKHEVTLIVDREKRYAEHFSGRFDDYMCNKGYQYPEFYQNRGEDVQPSRQTKYTRWVM